LEWAEEHPARGDFQLDVEINQCEDVAGARDRVLRAVRAYFSERVQSAQQDFRRLMLISESLWIGGWVAMWRPMEIFLYDWWPLLRRIRLLRRLAVMEVRLELSSDGIE
jgi:hypothetical protein